MSVWLLNWFLSWEGKKGSWYRAGENRWEWWRVYFFGTIDIQNSGESANVGQREHAQRERRLILYLHIKHSLKLYVCGVLPLPDSCSSRNHCIVVINQIQGQYRSYQGFGVPGISEKGSNKNSQYMFKVSHRETSWIIVAFPVRQFDRCIAANISASADRYSRNARSLSVALTRIFGYKSV